ncbi:hypothetical protein BSEG_04546 [Phocaeicola dorei 5_1_36/D4]|nr:hypothetical protein BSEG_04546 [Phocaeicola dorei 5_1_36/D4]
MGNLEEFESWLGNKGISQDLQPFIVVLPYFENENFNLPV